MTNANKDKQIKRKIEASPVLEHRLQHVAQFESFQHILKVVLLRDAQTTIGTIPFNVNTKQGRCFTQFLQLEVLLQLRDNCSILRTRFADYCHVIHIDRNNNASRIVLVDLYAVVTLNHLKLRSSEHLIQLLVLLMTSLFQPIQRSPQLQHSAMPKTRLKTLRLLHVDLMIEFSIQKRIGDVHRVHVKVL